MIQLTVIPLSGLHCNYRKKIIQKTFFTVSIKLLFLLGKIPEKSVSEKVDQEERIFGDLLQSSIPEGYATLSYKSVSGFLWINRSY
jgi:hypothetical protein